MKRNISSKITAGVVAGAAAVLLAAVAQAAPPAPASIAIDGVTQKAGVAAGLPVVKVAKRRVKVNRARRSIRRRSSVRRSIRSGRIVRRRLSPRRRYYRRRALTRGIGIGVGIGILAIIARESANAEFQSAMRRCARDYRSFDWDTGTYVSYGGQVRLCPYLRPYI